MDELALNILDVANNSVSAKATLIEIAIIADRSLDRLTITIADNGVGMDAEFAKKVTDPFTTSRKTRKVGLGIPLFKMAAENTGGSFSVESEKGKGTKVTAVFVLSSIDRAPLGDIASTMTALIGGAPDIDFTLLYSVDGEEYLFDTREVKEVLDGIPIDEMEIIAYIKGQIKENCENINGGAYI